MDHPRLETICLHLLRRCNLSCPHCWSHSSPSEDSELELNNILVFLDTLVDYGLKHVSLSGGEPTLYSSIIELIQWCINRQLSCTLTTNGVDTEKIAELIRFLVKLNYKIKENLNIRISIDGDKRWHDELRGSNTYVKALETIGIIRKYQHWVGINSVTWLGFEKSLPKLVPVLIKEKVDDWALITETPANITERESFDFQEALSRFNRCKKSIKLMEFPNNLTSWDYISWPQGGVVVESDGMVVLPGYGRMDDIVIGNIEHKLIVNLILEQIIPRINSGNSHFFFIK